MSRSAESTVPAPEAERLATVRGLGLLEAGGEERFDRIVKVLCALLDVPVGYLALMDHDRLVYKGAFGAQLGAMTPRGLTFCEQTVRLGRRVVVEDLADDDHFRDNPHVTHDGIRFYAGQPLRVDGRVVGTLCGLDRQPRRLPAERLDLLRDLAAWAENELVSAELTEVLARERHGASQLAAEKRRNELLLQFADQPVYGVDLDGRVTFANPAAARLLREELQDLVGVQFHDTYHRTHADGSPLSWEQCPTHAVLARGVARRVEGEVLHRRDGSTVEVELATAPVVVDGSVIGAVVTCNDMGRRRAAERLKDEFTSVVSHELRTPLTSIRGSLGLLASGRFGDLPPQAEGLVDMALSNTERLVRMVNDILDLERIEAGKMALECRTGPLRELLEAARDSVACVADAAGVSLQVSGGDVVVEADPDLMVRALVNLLGNAIKFSEPGGTVEVSAAAFGDEVHVHVRDEGRGIPANQLQTIFERFEQVDASDARQKGGTGLGLAITRSIAERHGGRVAVRSEPGKGSVFSVLLPAPGAADRPCA